MYKQFSEQNWIQLELKISYLSTAKDSFTYSDSAVTRIRRDVTTSLTQKDTTFYLSSFSRFISSKCKMEWQWFFIFQMEISYLGIGYLLEPKNTKTPQTSYPLFLHCSSFSNDATCRPSRHSIQLCQLARCSNRTPPLRSVCRWRHNMWWNFWPYSTMPSTMEHETIKLPSWLFRSHWR